MLNLPVAHLTHDSSFSVCLWRCSWWSRQAAIFLLFSEIVPLITPQCCFSSRHGWHFWLEKCNCVFTCYTVFEFRKSFLLFFSPVEFHYLVCEGSKWFCQRCLFEYKLWEISCHSDEAVNLCLWFCAFFYCSYFLWCRQKPSWSKVIAIEF